MSQVSDGYYSGRPEVQDQVKRLEAQVQLRREVALTLTLPVFYGSEPCSGHLAETAVVEEVCTPEEL